MSGSNPFPAKASLAPGPWVLAAMIVAVALSRLLPHPPNFAPIEAMALFGGAYFANRKLAVLVPLLALFASDLLLGHRTWQTGIGGSYFEYLVTPQYLPSLLANYACIALTVLLAFRLRGRVTGGRVLGYSLTGSVLFFVVSNFAVWLTAFSVPGYAGCEAGLLPCYVAALPFFQWTVLGTLFYAALLFGGFALLRQRLPALHARTVSQAPAVGHRLSRIYTRTGDDGSTGLGDGSRVAKDSARVSALGSIDEANSAIGWLLASTVPGDVAELLTSIQHELFDLGGELSLPGHETIGEAHVDRLERQLDRFNADLPPLKDFILPGGGEAASRCHMARTIVRRAERDVVALARIECVRAPASAYLNRLSDLLFVLARVLARSAGHAEPLWKPGRPGA